MIFCPSVPQSGTWFTLRLFERLGYRIEHTGVIMRDGKNIDPNEKIIMNTHVFPFYFQPNEYKYYWPSYGGDGIQEMIVRRDKMCMGSIKLFASMYKTIIPIRDPLASILTREARAPQLRHFCVTDAYVEVIKELSKNPNVFFLPVDLPQTFEHRKQLLIRLLKHCGLNWRDYCIELDRVALKWQKQNVTPNNRFHQPYNEGNIDQIKEWLGEKWAEVVYLKNMSGVIAPFLFELGYHKNKALIW